jgi:REP element-mobilizing transposase RayT
VEYYKRHLPHWQPEGAEFFIPFRLAESLPVEAVNKLKSYRKQLEKQDDSKIKDEIQGQIFKKYEGLLDQAGSGPTWLKEKNVAGVVQNSLHFYDSKAYDLYAYCVMPNHVHVVFKHLGDNEEINELNDVYSITKILHSIKSYTALECNKVLNRAGAFWQSESYDRVIRDQDELENTIRYTLHNPVKAGLVERWEEWSYSYCKSEFVDTFS